DGVVGGTSFAEGLNAGKTLGDGISNWPCGRKSRSLAFGAVGKGEARPALLKGLKPARRSPLSKPLARTQNKPFVLNPANRRIRTRTYGGVGGEEPRGSPYPDWNGRCADPLTRNGSWPDRCKAGSMQAYFDASLLRTEQGGLLFKFVPDPINHFLPL